MSDFQSERTVARTQKAWTCGWCGEREPAGTPCKVHTGVYGGDFWTDRYHPECYEALHEHWDKHEGVSPPYGSMVRGRDEPR